MRRTMNSAAIFFVFAVAIGAAAADDHCDTVLAQFDAPRAACYEGCYTNRTREGLAEIAEVKIN